MRCSPGWSRAGRGGRRAVALVVGGVALLAAFVVVQARRMGPLIDLALFRLRGFAAATLGALVAGIGIVGVVSYIPTVLQRGLGASLPSVMVLMLIWSASARDVVAAAPGARGQRPPAPRGALGVSAVGLVGLVVLVPGASEWRLLPGIVVLGVGYGAANAALGREAIAHLPAARAGMGSGTNNTARYVGSALGVTIAAVLAVPTAPTPVDCCAASTSRSSAGRRCRRRGRWSSRGWDVRRNRARPGRPAGGAPVDHQPAAVVLLDGVGQARGGAEGVQVLEVEGPDVPPRRVRLVLERNGDHRPRRATRSISASTAASAPRGRCSSRWTANTVSATRRQRDAPGVAGQGRDRRAQRRGTTPSSRAVPGTRSTAVTRWPSAASRSERNPKQQPSSTTCGPTASAAARSCTGAMPALVPPGRRRRPARRGCCGRRRSSRGRRRGRPRRTSPRRRRGRAGRGDQVVASQPARSLLSSSARCRADAAVDVDPEPRRRPVEPGTFRGRPAAVGPVATGRHRPTISVARSVAALSRPVRSRTTCTRLQYSAYAGRSQPPSPHE